MQRAQGASQVRDWDSASAPTRAEIALLVVVSIIFLSCRLYWAHVSTVEPDEAFTLRLIRHTWGDLFRGAVHDKVHPPLFYLTLKLWLTIVGENLFLLRLLPVLTSCVWIAPTWLLSRELRMTPITANLGLFLVAVNSFLVRFSQELRMYSLLALLGLCSLWLFTRYLGSTARFGHPLPALVCVNILMVYTQYLGWVIVGFEGFYLLWRSRSKFLPYSVGAAFMALLFAPWALLVAFQGPVREGMEAHLGWIGRPDWRGLVTYYARLHGPYRDGLDFSKWKTVVGFLLFGVPVAIAVLRAARQSWRNQATPSSPPSRPPLAWFVFFGVAPVLVLFGLSWMLPVSIFGPRYLIFTAVPYLLLCAVSLNQLSPRSFRAAAVAAAIIWAAVGYVQEVRLGDYVDWIRLVAGMRKAEAVHAISPGAPVQLYVHGHAEPIRYALELAGETRFQLETIDDIDRVRGDRFWIAYQESYWKADSTRDMASALSGRGYVVAEDHRSGLAKHAGHLSLFVRSSSARPPAQPR